MHYLLDTNIFLWWLNGDRKLKDNVKREITDPNNFIFISVANAWEISIKHRAGKLPLKTSLKKCFEISDFQVLNLNLEHILVLDKLPLLHKDPFDRMLIAQAIHEKAALITSDDKIEKYKIDILKA